MNTPDLHGLLQLILLLLALPPAAACAYLLLLTLLSAAPRPPPRSMRKLRFDIVVPAHDEAKVIQRAVTSLRQIDWPRDRFRVVVVADNCTDATAALARAAGAEVIERFDGSQRGKGYALAYGFEWSRAQAWADAVVVIDADSAVSTNLLEAFAARIEGGAEAVQAFYGILNPWDSWRTRLLAIAYAAFHTVRSRARERLGVSCGIRGNGWCVTHRLLVRVPYRAFSLTEDVEFGIALALAGVRVHFAGEAQANADMVSGEALARTQRERWEAGRFEQIRRQTLPLLAAALRRRSRLCLDLAIDLMVLPISYVALGIVLLALAAGAASLLDPSLRGWLWLPLACTVALLLYVLRGWQLSGLGARGLLDLARIPGFLLWKTLLLLRRRPSQEWVRTSRERT